MGRRTTQARGIALLYLGKGLKQLNSMQLGVKIIRIFLIAFSIFLPWHACKKSSHGNSCYKIVEKTAPKIHFFEKV